MCSAVRAQSAKKPIFWGLDRASHFNLVIIREMNNMSFDRLKDGESYGIGGPTF